MRGRWMGSKTIVDTYIDLEQPYPDAKVAACLAGPLGPVLYEIENTTLCDNDFINLFPNLKDVLDDSILKLLGLALVWASFQENLNHALLNERIRSIIFSKFNFSNPIKKTSFVINGYGGQVSLIHLNNNINDPRQRHDSNIYDEIVGLNSNYLTLRKRVEEVNNNMLQQLQKVSREITENLRNINRNIKRIAIQPVVRQSTYEKSLIRSQKKAVLMKCPRDLYILWKEYEFGVSRNKPAKDFTRHERGEVRFKYSIRNIFWDKVLLMTLKGYTSDSAIDNIYQKYGRSQSVTKILTLMRKDRKDNN